MSLPNNAVRPLSKERHPGPSGPHSRRRFQGLEHGLLVQQTMQRLEENGTDRRTALLSLELVP